MELEGVAEAATPDGSTLRYESEGLAIWVMWSEHAEGNKAWFDHRRGRVVVKNPDEEIIRKMVGVASALGAKVQGDDGEDYDESGQPRLPPSQPANEAKPWWKRLLGRLATANPPLQRTIGAGILEELAVGTARR